MADDQTQPGSTIEHITLQGGPLDGESMDWASNGGDTFYCFAAAGITTADSDKRVHMYRRAQEGESLFAYQGVQKA